MVAVRKSTGIPVAMAALCLLASPLLADQFGDFTYADKGASITITAFSPTATGNVVIPETIIGKPVTAFWGSAFSYRSGITGITIPESVHQLEAGSFDSCRNLANVTLPSSLTTIGDNAFSGCWALTSITLPSGLTSIGRNAFAYCKTLTTVSIPSSVTSLGEYAFTNCTVLGSVTLPPGLTGIPNACFASCPGLTSLNLPVGVTTIGINAFQECDGLQSVTIPAAVTSIGDYAFAGCDGLLTVEIPASLTSIGAGALQGCANLQSIQVSPTNPTFSSLEGVLFNKSGSVLLQYPCGLSGPYIIPEGVTAIDNAFNTCTRLTAVNLPSSLSNIGDFAFIRCSGLTLITIPPTVTRIGVDAFAACTGLTNVVIPNSVTTLASFAFLGCNRLTSVVIPSSVASVGAYAFYSCGGLVSVTIQNGVTAVSDSAFRYCKSLVEVSLPASLQIIGAAAFRDCTALEQFNVAADNAFYAAEDGVLFNKAKTILIQYTCGKNGPYVIPSGVSAISDGAFSSSAKLSEVTLKNGVSTIGYYAFYGCAGLTSITLPASVSLLNNGAFQECKKLKSLIFLGNAPSMPSVDGTFYNVASDFHVYYYQGATGFSAPVWLYGLPPVMAINMGASSAVKPWLISNGFLHDAGLSTDSNGDGVPLLMAYALKLDPKQNLAGSMPIAVLAGNQMSLTFYAGSAGVSYKVESSADMQNWNTLGVTLSAPDANGFKTATVDASGPVLFMRVVASY